MRDISAISAAIFVLFGLLIFFGCVAKSGGAPEAMPSGSLENISSVTGGEVEETPAGCAYGNPACGSDFDCVNNTCIEKMICGQFGCQEEEISSDCCVDCGCPEGYSCINQTCAPVCGDDITTAEETPETCCADAGCPEKQECVGNRCIQRCETAEDCSTTYPCSISPVGTCWLTGYDCIDNICVQKQGCEYRNPVCYLNEFCKDNVCVKKTGGMWDYLVCDENHECADEYGDLRKGCAYWNPRCKNDFEDRFFEICENNTCKEIECGECEYPVSGVCTPYQCCDSYDFDYTGSSCGNGICEDYENSLDTPCLRDCSPSKNYNVFSDNRFEVMVPKGYDALGPANLQDMKFCYCLIKDFLGIKPKLEVISLGIIRLTGEEEEYFPLPEITYGRTQELLDMDLQDVVTDDPEGFLYKSSPTYCSNTHEMTHVFAQQLKLPLWANEGLAEYTQKNVMNGSKDYFECREDGWYGMDFWVTDKEMFFPYSDLDQDYTNSDIYSINYGPKYYHSAMCVWEYIDETYGDDSIKEIIQKNLEEVQDPEYTSDDFVDKVLVPVLGDDIRGVLRDRFGID